MKYSQGLAYGMLVQMQHTSSPLKVGLQDSSWDLIMVDSTSSHASIFRSDHGFARNQEVRSKRYSMVLS